MTYKEFIANIKSECYNKNISHAELAKMVGVSEVSISRWFNYERIPDAHNCEKLCNALNLHLSFSNRNTDFKTELISKLNDMKNREVLLIFNPNATPDDIYTQLIGIILKGGIE